MIYGEVCVREGELCQDMFISSGSDVCIVYVPTYVFRRVQPRVNGQARVYCCSRCSGTRTQGFCFSCQSNGAAAWCSHAAGSLRDLQASAVRGRNERWSEREGGERVRRLNTSFIVLHTQCLHLIVWINKSGIDSSWLFYDGSSGLSIWYNWHRTCHKGNMVTHRCSLHTFFPCTCMFRCECDSEWRVCPVIDCQTVQGEFLAFALCELETSCYPVFTVKVLSGWDNELNGSWGHKYSILPSHHIAASTKI